MRLTGVRLGGYNVWEKRPGANFHGALDEVRICRGMLSDRQVAELAGQLERGAEAGPAATPNKPG